MYSARDSETWANLNIRMFNKNNTLCKSKEAVGRAAQHRRATLPSIPVSYCAIALRHHSNLFTSVKQYHLKTETLHTALTFQHVT